MFSVKPFLSAVMLLGIIGSDNAEAKQKVRVGT
jgi:hypothetical protein